MLESLLTLSKIKEENKEERLLVHPTPNKSERPIQLLDQCPIPPCTDMYHTLDLNEKKEFMYEARAS